MQQPLQIYNSLTKKKECFKPHTPPYVGIYVCGPTVYGKAHLGHARIAITFDVVFRYLKHLHYNVRYVRNITDVGHLERDADEGKDKIQQQAIIEALSPMEVAQYYTNSYRKNMEQLNVLPPNIEPCASGHIPDQIAVIEKILQKGLAYVVDGSVYFDIIKYTHTQPYGKLSGRNIEAIRSGSRPLSGQSRKKHSADFALWKKATPAHIMQWASPWSIGFPGWHIECTAMATKYLGPQFDIHGGGMDLLFPHHECELEQAQAAYQTDLATYWMHNNLVTIDGIKMGKSLGNVIALDELFTGTHSFLDQPYSPMTLRFFILQAHYRGVVTVSLDGFKAAYQGYRKLINGWHMLLRYTPQQLLQNNGPLDATIYADCTACYNAMNDDFNTAKVLATLFGLLKTIHKLYHGQLNAASLSAPAFHTLRMTYSAFVTDILGLQEEHQTVTSSMLEVVSLLYQQAKTEKKYHQIDLIRSALHNMDIALQDHPHHGLTWQYE